MKLEGVSTLNEAQQANMADRWEGEREAFIHTIETLNATHQIHTQELHENLSKIMQEMEHFMINLQQMDGVLENQHNTIEYLTKTTKEQETQNRQEEDTVTCISDVNMQCSTEKRDDIGLGQNEPIISASIPDGEDLVDLTGVSEDNDECSCGGDYLRLVLFSICVFFSMAMGNINVCFVFTLMPLSITGVSYIYTWFFYPPFCLSFITSCICGSLYTFSFFISCVICLIISICVSENILATFLAFAFPILSPLILSSYFC